MSDTLASALAINPEVRPQTVQSFQAELWPVVAKPESRTATAASCPIPPRLASLALAAVGDRNRGGLVLA